MPFWKVVARVIGAAELGGAGDAAGAGVGPAGSGREEVEGVGSTSGSVGRREESSVASIASGAGSSKVASPGREDVN